MANPTSTGLSHREVVDERHAKVGKVTDVIYDDVANEPRWVAIKTGLVGGERLTPLAGAYLADDGALVLPFERNTVKHAPKAPSDHVLTREVEEELDRYYRTG